MKYYYLITSLPELNLEDQKPPVTRAEFETKAYDALDGRDKELFDLLKLRIDNQNLTTILSDGSNVKTNGNFDGEDLKERIKYQYGLPRYMLDLLTVQDDKSGKLKEDVLWELYLDYCMKKNTFLKQYFTFDRNIKNIIIKASLRKTNTPFADKIINSDDMVTESIMHSNMQDFGLGRGMPYINRIIEFLEQKQYFEMEQYIDILRFEIIDDINRFNYFNIEHVLGYSLKLEILERWAALNDKKGTQYLWALSGKDLDNKDLYKFELTQ
ncbi:MAG: DUF2764 family protein [bacterium]